jgi:transcriptional regulator with XRE-family HTH domain
VISKNGRERLHYRMTAKRIRKLLRDNDWQQRQLAALCRRSEGCISHWVSGHSRPRIDDMRVIADAFGVSIDWLLGRDL